MPDYTIPSTPVTGTTPAGTFDSYDLPNYVGELFDLMPQDTPFLSAIGGLNGGKAVMSREWTWQIEDGEAASATAQKLENQAPSGDVTPRQQVRNVVEIHQEGVDFGYTAQAAVEQLAADSARILGDQPVKSPMQKEIDKKIVKIARDLEMSFLNGTYQNPSDNLTPRRTRGILSALSTHVRDYTVSSDTNLQDSLNALLVGMFGSSTTEAAAAPLIDPVIFVNAQVKIWLSQAYGLQPRDRTVGGLAIDTFITDFGSFGVVLDRYMPADELLLADLSVIQPVFLPIPGKGVFFVEPMAKTKASDEAQIYGEIGLEYGPESYHGRIHNITAPA